MVESFDSVIQDLKLCVNKMLVERNKIIGKQETVSFAPIWSDLLSVYSYVMNLSSDDLKNIRFHTSPISGPPIWETWYPYPEPIPEEEAKKLGYAQAISDLPEKYWIGESPIPSIPRPLGVLYKGHIVNPNAARFQGYIRSLYHAGALSFVEESKEKQLVVEVGGGYGGLAHNLGTILGKQMTYVIIDLPELFMFQGAFLAVNNPEKAIYVYDSDTFNSEFLSRGIYDYDFVLIPNFALDKLREVKEIALLMNMHSFQEMSGKQVQEYLDFAKEKVTYCIFSDNADKHPHNRTDLTSISALLEKRFALYPTVQYYDEIYKKDAWIARYQSSHKQYFGFPQNSSRVFTDSEVRKFLPPISLRRRLQRMLPLPLQRIAISCLGKISIG